MKLNVKELKALLTNIPDDWEVKDVLEPYFYEKDGGKILYYLNDDIYVVYATPPKDVK